MANVIVVTPANWFTLPDLAQSGDAGCLVQLSLADAEGRYPLADLSLDELLALHRTFGSWWAAIGPSDRSPYFEAGTYDRLLADHRRLVERKATSDEAQAAPARLAFPALDHRLLGDSTSALGLLRFFLAVVHSPSIADWARDLANLDDVVSAARQAPWIRFVLQKAALEERTPAVVSVLKSLYEQDSARQDLLAAESHALEDSGLTDLGAWAVSLGLDRPNRSGPRFLSAAPSSSRLSSGADVTVLVPSYNHEQFIERALASVRSQTDAGVRILVMDDCSTDRTVDRAVAVRDPRLSVRVNDRNLGLGDSVLRALDEVTTPYVALLNSDDLFHPERIERCRRILDSSPQAQLVATDIVPIDKDDRPVTVETVSCLRDGWQIADWIRWFSDARPPDTSVDLLAELLERNFLLTSSNVVCRTEYLRASADSLRGLKYCLDWQLFLNAAADGALVYLREPLLGYRLHATNTVWWDKSRQASYPVEVRRVLGSTLARLVELSRGAGGRDLATTVDLFARHAVKHSEVAGRPAAVDRENAITATRALAEIAREDANVALGARRLADEDRVCLGAALTRADEERAQLRAALGRSEQDRTELQAALDRARVERTEEVRQMRASPEWVIGDAIWNRTRLSRHAPKAVKAMRIWRDRRNRWALAGGRVAQRAGLTKPRAVVASCWNFPHHSHTFVYEEMRALEWAGFDARVFCCGTNPRSELHPAFEDLWRRRVVLESDWTFNQRDYEYFRRTRGERVDALLTRLGEATGRSREDLLAESIVMMGFTFARHVELSGARYLHTYFFYDQSFLALMAGYLLQIPRGITTYADHMLSDYAFKCVPLQIELADILVATSRRIRDELNAIADGRFAAKIIVKPNGVDTSRFTPTPVAARLGEAGDPELISVSRIEPKKGLVHLVEAVGILKDRGINVRLHIVGGADAGNRASAECLDQLRARIGELGLADRVVLHGVLRQPQLMPLMARARLFVAPYVEVASGDKDGIPTAVLEAMSTGLPVIATDAGSIVEAVTSGCEGLCVPQRDPGRLAAAVEQLLGDPSLYAQMSDAARQRAVSEFDVHVTERRLHERIRACLDRRTAEAADIGKPLKERPC